MRNLECLSLLVHFQILKITTSVAYNSVCLSFDMGYTCLSRARELCTLPPPQLCLYYPSRQGKSVLRVRGGGKENDWMAARISG